eukprot:TRINITY_DN5878_c0_g1_i1.p1 TRINITY_DN5878_c0_g1~~TRINITY_DN5878_c0_g1_i1.p1  ORF type:complete len:268 (-),score=67.12 TRINITY_DN5878_c0_g1_i1:1831-2634(-)
MLGTRVVFLCLLTLEVLFVSQCATAVDTVIVRNEFPTITIGMPIFPVIVDYVNIDSNNFSKVLIVSLKDTANDANTVATNTTSIGQTPVGTITINLDITTLNITAGMEFMILVQMIDSILVDFPPGWSASATTNMTFTVIMPTAAPPTAAIITPTQTSMPNAKNQGSSMSAVVGGSIGGILLILGIIVVLVVLLRKGKFRRGSINSEGVGDQLVDDQEMLAKKLDFLQLDSPRTTESVLRPTNVDAPRSPVSAIESSEPPSQQRHSK